MVDVAALHIAIGFEDISITPLTQMHREHLRMACALDTEIWQMYPISYGPDHFDASFDGFLANPGRLGFAILSGGKLVGMTAYLNIDTARAILEIGNSYIIPSLRGTGFNPRLKKLMIDHAFSCGFRRIEFRVDARNLRSQAAVVKIGGVREGLLRQERITWTGHVRDTVLFSILAGEWAGH